MKKTEAWDNEEVIVDPHIFFASLEKGLAEATHSIDLESYIFSTDELGRRIVHCLVDAAKRGVHVRVMVDGFGSPGWARHFQQELLAAGAKARVFHPMPWRALNPIALRMPSLFRILRLLSTMNERNHRKVCIIDRRRAWLGGMNISSAHLKWRDTGTMLEGTQVQPLCLAFQRAWLKAWYPFSKPVSKIAWRRFTSRISLGHLVRLNATRKSRSTAFHELLAHFEGAALRIWITNAYFIPPRRIRHALQRAARRGVDVRLLVPRYPDVFFIHWVSSALYHGLLKSGVRIFEYLPAPLHAKTLVIDQWASVGTSNLNYRSLTLDLEVDVSLTSPRSLRALTQAFENDLTHSKEVSPDSWRKRPLWERALGHLLLVFRKWM
jgi:cardiolipin synthase